MARRPTIKKQVMIKNKKTKASQARKTDTRAFLKGKKILVTGGTGSIGSAIVHTLLSQYEPEVVRIYSRDVAKQAQLRSVLPPGSNARFIVGDLRDENRLLSACEDIDIILHAGAFKYVPEGEYNPFEAIQSNVIGTQNVVNTALKVPSVTHVMMISTDKAVGPTSTMGASKLLAERLMVAANYIKGKKDKIFSVVRFGNVLGSAGSVLPIFKQHAQRGIITITHPEMVRFFMTIPDAVRLILNATPQAHGGEIFILKLPAVRIKDLAEVCARRYASPPAKVVLGTMRPGEKIHEGLMTDDEARTGFETNEYFIVVPQITIANMSPDSFVYAHARPCTSNTYLTTTAPMLDISEVAELVERAERGALFGL